MMRYNVAQLLKEDIGSSRAYSIGQDSDTRDGENRLRLMRTDRGIWASARLNSTAPSVCGRCLSPFAQSLDLEIEEEYYPTADVHTGKAIEVPEEQGAFTIDDANILDLTEAVRQYRIAVGPMKPLCREDCQGLCTVCGGNRNLQECACLHDQIDPRLAPLRRLLAGEG